MKTSLSDARPPLVLQYPGWSLMPDGSIRVAEATEDSLGTYTCVPYNALGTMGMSPPATLVLKVDLYSDFSCTVSSLRFLRFSDLMSE